MVLVVATPSRSASAREAPGASIRVRLMELVVAARVPPDRPTRFIRFFVSLAFFVCSLGAADAASQFDIQAAIDALPATGGVVRIPAGTYEITAPLIVRRGDVRGHR